MLSASPLNMTTSAHTKGTYEYLLETIEETKPICVTLLQMYEKGKAEGKEAATGAVMALAMEKVKRVDTRALILMCMVHQGLPIVTAYSIAQLKGEQEVIALMALLDMREEALRDFREKSGVDPLTLKKS